MEAWRVHTLSAKTGAQKLNSRAGDRWIKMFVIFFLIFVDSFGFLLLMLFYFLILKEGEKTLPFVCASVS